MIYRMCAGLALAFFATNTSAQDIGPGISVLQAGLVCPQDAGDLASAEWVAQSRSVPAVDGIAFGVRARAATADGFDRVTVTVTHPPFAGSGETLQTFRTSIPAQGLGSFYYTLDDAREIVFGQWRFRAVTDAGVELYAITFRTYPPTPSDGVIVECAR